MTTTRSRMLLYKSAHTVAEYVTPRTMCYTPLNVLHPVERLIPYIGCLRGHIPRYSSALSCHCAPWRGSTGQAYSNSPIRGNSCQ